MKIKIALSRGKVRILTKILVGDHWVLFCYMLQRMRHTTITLLILKCIIWEYLFTGSPLYEYPSNALLPWDNYVGCVRGKGYKLMSCVVVTWHRLFHKKKHIILGTLSLKAAHVKPTVNASTSTRLGTFFLPPNLKVVLKFCRHCADIAGKKAPQKFQFCVRSTITIWYHIILFRRVLSPLLNSSLWLLGFGFWLPEIVNVLQNRTLRCGFLRRNPFLI